MSIFKKTIVICCLLITLVLAGCSNNGVASKTDELYNHEKPESVEKVTLTNKDENQFLEKAYQIGKKDIKKIAKTLYYPIQTLEAVSVDVSTENGKANISEVLDSISTYETSTNDFNELLSEIDDIFISISDSNQDSIEDLYNQKNELVKKVLRSYVYGVLDRTIQDMETINEQDLDVKLSKSDYVVSEEKLELAKTEFLKYTDYFKSMLIDIKNNYDMEPIDKSIYETSREEWYNVDSFIYSTLAGDNGIGKVYMNVFSLESYVPYKAN